MILRCLFVLAFFSIAHDGAVGQIRCQVGPESSLEILIRDVSFTGVLSFANPLSDLTTRNTSAGHWRVEPMRALQLEQVSPQWPGYVFRRELMKAEPDSANRCNATLVFRGEPTWAITVESEDLLRVQQLDRDQGQRLKDGQTPFDTSPSPRNSAIVLIIATSRQLQFTVPVRHSQVAKEPLSWSSTKIKNALCAERSNNLKCRRFVREAITHVIVPKAISFTLVPQ